MSQSRGIMLVMVLAVALVISAAVPGFAADAKSVAPVFASVDLEKLGASYDKGKQIEDQLMGLQAALQQKLQLRNANKMLGDAEFNQLMDLKTKAAPTPDDQKKMSDLLAVSTAREKELQSLQQKPNATDAEKSRMADLQAQADQGDAGLRQDQASYADQFQKKRDELQKQATQEVDLAISSVAKDKGITLVFSKGVVLYSNNDITDDVLKKLNKK
ncbi:MAG TPA: OmpH family outer membrane protein [Armatimonadota bacterium]